MLIEKNLAFRTLCFLASTCNSIIIETYVDIIRVSHVFDGCQRLRDIAETWNSALRTGLDDITAFLSTSFLPFHVW